MSDVEGLTLETECWKSKRPVLEAEQPTQSQEPTPKAKVTRVLLCREQLKLLQGKSATAKLFQGKSTEIFPLIFFFPSIQTLISLKWFFNDSIQLNVPIPVDNYPP